MRFENISFRITGKRGVCIDIFRRLTLSVNEGDRILIKGPNGSGKSTFLRIAAGLRRQTDGQITFPDLVEDKVRAFVPQDYRKALFPWLTIRNNVRFVAGSGSEGRFNDLLDRVQLKLAVDKFPYEFSGGEQQLLVLCATLARTPDILWLDEPLAAVDIKRRELAREMLYEFVERYSTTFFMVTHDQRDESMFDARLLEFSGDVEIAPVVHHSRHS